jgi:hypothetical protein
MLCPLQTCGCSAKTTAIVTRDETQHTDSEKVSDGDKVSIVMLKCRVLKQNQYRRLPPFEQKEVDGLCLNLIMHTAVCGRFLVEHLMHSRIRGFRISFIWTFVNLREIVRCIIIVVELSLFSASFDQMQIVGCKALLRNHLNGIIGQSWEAAGWFITEDAFQNERL